MIVETTCIACQGTGEGCAGTTCPICRGKGDIVIRQGDDFLEDKEKIMKEFILHNYFKDFRITQNFGKTPFALSRPTYYPIGGHTGIDYNYRYGTPVKAVHGGYIVQDEDIDKSAKGIYVVIIDPDQLIATHYYHLLNNCVRLKQKIEPGQLIGWSGFTGLCDPPNEYGAHLHFGLCLVDENWHRLNKDNDTNGFIDPLGENVRWLDV